MTEIKDVAELNPLRDVASLRKAIEDIDLIRDLPDGEDIMEQLVELQKLVLEKIDSFEEALCSRKALAEKTVRDSHNYNARLKGEIISKELREILGGKSG